METFLYAGITANGPGRYQVFAHSLAFDRGS